MVNLTRIYTRTGDGGQTRLADMSLTAKTDPRVEAYGDVDEANSIIGVALATGELPNEVAASLARIQNELFDAGADLSTPLAADPKYPPLRITPDYVDRLEADCDRYGDPLPNLRSFILPGGTMAAAQLHVARTVIRRAERAGWAAAAQHGTGHDRTRHDDTGHDDTGHDDTGHDDVGHDDARDNGTGELADNDSPGGVNPLALTYLNRLSDLLFILTRVVNGTDGDVLWVPGGERTTIASGRDDSDPTASHPTREDQERPS